MAKKMKMRLRSRSDSPYGYINHTLKGYINEIEAPGVAVYWFISTYTQEGKEYCWVSRKTIAKGLNYDIRVIDKYLKKLESTKPPLIKRLKRPGTSDKIYFLPVEAKQEVSTKNIDTAKNVETVSTKNVEGGLHKKCSTNKNHIKKNQRTITKFAKKFEDGADFTNVYFSKLIDMFNERFKKLNKTNKGKCQESISSLKKLNELGIKKKRIKEVLLWYLKNMDICTDIFIHSVSDFCKHFHIIEDRMEDND